MLEENDYDNGTCSACGWPPDIIGLSAAIAGVIHTKPRVQIMLLRGEVCLRGYNGTDVK